MKQITTNFVDKTFTVLADTLLKILPTIRQEKEAFVYYRKGMASQSDGDYAKALENYCASLKLEEDLIQRSYILYNIGLIYSNNGQYFKALKYYRDATELNTSLAAAFNNSAVIYHYNSTILTKKGDFRGASLSFEKAAYNWKKAIRLMPNNYIEAQNWLSITQRT
jgi:tetratricopeptide (TPR) repeat protein